MLCIFFFKDFHRVDSGLSTRRFRKVPTPEYTVSGADISQWVNPAECMPLFPLQDLLRIGHSSTKTIELKRIIGFAKEGGGGCANPNTLLKVASCTYNCIVKCVVTVFVLIKR